MTRLDKYLVDSGHFESRNRALEAIKSGRVEVDNRVAKASLKVDSNSNIEIENQKFYVSRAAKKLEGFLSTHPIDIENKNALDIGSSTGGFAQILLENKISTLDCVDVGRDQLHHSLRGNPKLSLYEDTDIRSFEPSHIYDIITCDVSFISILQIMDHIDHLATINTDIIILYKPQFEVGRTAKRDSRGVVTDTHAIAKSTEEFISYTTKLGWSLIHSTPSILSGKEGNMEYLYHLRK